MKYSDFEKAVGNESFMACRSVMAAIGELTAALQHVEDEHKPQLSKLIRDTLRRSRKASERASALMNENGFRSMVSNASASLIEKIADHVMSIRAESENFQSDDEDIPTPEDLKKLYGDGEQEDKNDQ